MELRACMGNADATLSWRQPVQYSFTKVSRSVPADLFQTVYRWVINKCPCVEFWTGYL